MGDTVRYVVLDDQDQPVWVTEETETIRIVIDERETGHGITVHTFHNV